jgi:cytochrome o ubiquinol oxidase operon protein cyoD
MGSYRSYITGFILSLLLTFAAFGAVWAHQGQGLLTTPWLIAALLVLAAAQLMVQLLFFLHVGNETKPRWNMAALLFAGLVLLIIVGGSLWIMKNLDYHMDPTATSEFLIKDEGITNHQH